MRIRLAVVAMDVALAPPAVEPRPGVETAFAALRARGVRVCLTTTMARATRDHVVDLLGWRDVVDFTLGPERDGPLRAPPCPDLVLEAALRTGIDDVREIAVAAATVDDLLAGVHAGASLIIGVVVHADDETALRSVPRVRVIRSIDQLATIVGAAGDDQPCRDVHSTGGGM